MTTVLLVDDHALLRKGFRMVLQAEPDLEVVGEASDGTVALDQVRALRPDVVVMDVRMPGGDGITATAQIVAEHPGTRVLVLTRSTSTSTRSVHCARGRAGSSSRTPNRRTWPRPSARLLAATQSWRRAPHGGCSSCSRTSSRDPATARARDRTRDSRT